MKNKNKLKRSRRKNQCLYKLQIINKITMNNNKMKIQKNKTLFHNNNKIA